MIVKNKKTTFILFGALCASFQFLTIFSSSWALRNRELDNIYILSEKNNLSNKDFVIFDLKSKTKDDDYILNVSRLNNEKSYGTKNVIFSSHDGDLIFQNKSYESVYVGFDYLRDYRMFSLNIEFYDKYSPVLSILNPVVISDTLAKEITDNCHFSGFDELIGLPIYTSINGIEHNISGIYKTNNISSNKNNNIFVKNFLNTVFIPSTELLNKKNDYYLSISKDYNLNMSCYQMAKSCFDWFSPSKIPTNENYDGNNNLFDYYSNLNKRQSSPLLVIAFVVCLLTYLTFVFLFYYKFLKLIKNISKIKAGAIALIFFFGTAFISLITSYALSKQVITIQGFNLLASTPSLYWIVIVSIVLVFLITFYLFAKFIKIKSEYTNRREYLVVDI